MNSVDFWVEELTKDADPNHFDFSNDGHCYTLNIKNYGQWMWNCGYNAGLVNLQTKVNTYCVPQWISVKDRLPESMIYDYPCFLVTDGSLIHMAYFVENEWMFADSGQAKDKMFYKVTHWMALPEPPKENNYVDDKC